MKLFFELLDLLSNLFLMYGNPYVEKQEFSGFDELVKQSGKIYALREGNRDEFELIKSLIDNISS